MTAPQPSGNSEQFRAMRLACGLTQQDVATCLGVSARCVQTWESGDRTMSPALWELFILIQVAEGRLCPSAMYPVRPSLRKLVPSV